VVELELDGLGVLRNPVGGRSEETGSARRRDHA
jgi:hypothetical protein